MAGHAPAAVAAVAAAAVTASTAAARAAIGVGQGERFSGLRSPLTRESE